MNTSLITASRSYVVVDAGAMQLASNVLERANKDEVLVEIKKATMSAPVVTVSWRPSKSSSPCSACSVTRSRSGTS